ncbi:MAG: YfjI family protein [Chromatiales bacterium]|nr:YfjI family protein [Chromatiales bacterium]
MSALGSVIGRQVGIRLKQKDDWTEYANVWGCVIGPPSALKSPAIQQALKPFKWLQVAADERHQSEMQGYKQDMEDFELRKKLAKKNAEKALTKDPLAAVARDTTPPPEKPPERTYWTSNATAEALGVKLAENPVGLFLERDELSSLLVELEDERNATARGLYLSGWSGREGYRFDRIMRGTTYIPKFALSVFGGIQPGPLARYVRGASSGERADGLLQRFQLAVWPDPARFEYVDRHPSQAARERARLLFERADNLDAEAIGYRDQFGEDPPYVRLSPEAQGLFVEWYTDFMRHRRQVEAEGAESDPICAHFGKYPGLVGKLALILHIADDPDARAVSETTLLKALAWLDYLTPHARRIYHAVEHPETGAASLLLARVRRGELPEKFTARDIYRKGWHGLADSDAVLRACDLLQEYDWLIDVSPEWKGTGRPPAKLYAVSPAVEVAS